nr:hypothetical protein CoNPh37_CDS0194 [Staphylococcus phage S-CoN_Ph37]
MRLIFVISEFVFFTISHFFILILTDIDKAFLL